ncbi:MAG: S-layer homology domain-containing protein [Clostridia bacterium]|nr:S-layer homology domain-containing protein [Clostridia bacterium]
MISKKYTAFLIIFTLLVSLIPSGFMGTVAEAATSVVPKDGKLHVLDFSSAYTLNTAQTNGTYELTDTIKDTGKSKSMKWTFTTKETKVSANLMYQRQDWLECSDLKFRIYNPQDYNVTFVLLFFQESGYVGTNIYREYAVMTPGWNTYTVSIDSINNKVPESDNLSIMFNIGGFRKNGQYNYNVGDVLYLSGAYIEFPSYGQTISSPSPSIGNGEGYVPSDLYGNNTYSLNFEENLWNGSHVEGNTTYNVENYVTVYERNGSSYTQTTQGYDVSVNSNGDLDITFDSELNNSIYKVVVNSDAVITATGKKLAEDAEFYFSVGMASVIFASTSTEPSKTGGIIANKPGFEYTINFNNDIDPFDLENMVSVSPDASYNVSGDDKYVKLKFTEALQPGTTYTVTLSDNFADTNGSYISGTKEFSFTTAKTIGSDGVIFDASNTADLNDVAWKTTGSNFTVKNVNGKGILGASTIEFKKNTTSSLSYTFNLSDKVIPDFADYNYVNMLVYSSEITDNTINVIFSGNDNSFTASTAADWQGWKTVSVPLSSVTGIVGYTDLIKLQYGLGIKANYLFIDRVWLSDSVPESLTFVSSEFEDGEYQIPVNLGGDNSYTFTFENNIKDFNLDKAVSVKKFVGTSYTDYTDYDVQVSGNKLNVIFTPALTSNQTFSIDLDLSKLLSAEYSIGSGSVSREFTVGGAPTYFSIRSSSIEDGSVVNSLSEFKLTFNNKPDSTYYIPEYIWVYKDGSRIYNSYEASLSDNTVILTFDETAESGEYTVKVSPDYKDVYGNSFVGNDSVSFTYQASESNDDNLIVFTAETDEKFDILNSKYTKTTEGANLYSQTAKLAYSAGLAGSTNVDGFINRGIVMNPAGMKYLNILAYSPKETENTAHVVLYSDVANNQYGSMKYVLPLDWSGWKIISIPMSSFVKSNTYDAILFNIGGWSYKDIYESGYVLFDAIWFSKEAPVDLTLVSSSFESGHTGAAICGEVLELTFNTNINTEHTPTVTFKDENGNSVNDYTISSADNKMTFVFGELNPNTTYTLEVSDVMSANFTKLSESVEIDFTTASDGVFVGDITYSAKTVTAKVNNYTTDSQSVTLTAYAVSDDNVILEKQEITVSAAASGEIPVSVTFATMGDIKEVKAFVRQNDYKFMSQKYLSHKGTQSDTVVTSKLSGSKNIKVDSANVNLNVLELNATLSGVSNAALVEVAASNGNILSANVLNADKNGNITYNYVFPNLVATGKYKVTVYADDMSAYSEVCYISKSDRDRLFSLANGTSQINLVSCLNDLKDYLGISSYSDAKISDLAVTMISTPGFANYPEVYNFIGYYDALITDINSASWGELTLLIEDNSTTLTSLSNTDVAYFVSLGDEAQNKISQILRAKLPQDTLAEFLTALTQAVVQYKNIPAQTPQYGSGSSGGGGGGSSSASFPSSGTTNPYTPIEADKTFNDLSDASWATESIMTLYKNGIISEAADKKFRPNDNITREEFVKMIVCAFANDTAPASHRFSDEIDGAWYNTYLAKAYALGITKGFEDGTFGVGQNITREDMITIASRALEILGNQMTMAENMSFSDKGDISDYAYGYVNTMTNLGIVNGMGDGSFAPKQNATRAQAAKIIASLMELY